MRELSELGFTGCGDNSCNFARPVGLMGTNGRCRCRIHKYQLAINAYRKDFAELESQLAAHAGVVEAAREVINTSMVVGDTSVVNTKELMSLAAALAASSLVSGHSKQGY